MNAHIFTHHAVTCVLRRPFATTFDITSMCYQFTFEKREKYGASEQKQVITNMAGHEKGLRVANASST